MKLDVKSFSLTCGIILGACVFLMVWWIAILEGGFSEDPTFLGRMYIGFSITPLGSVAGLIWGFVDGAIGGAILAWLYNLLIPRLSKGGE